MLSIAIGLLCVSSAFAQHTTAGTTSKPKNVAVAVYYESLCPYARAFITDQLYPALSTNLGKYITLTLYPYGIATTTKYPNNTYTFDCQHGPDECLGNKYHACALALINNGTPTEGLSYNNDTIKYVTCLAKNVEETEVNPNNVCAPYGNGFGEKITRCATDNQGDQLLAEHGKATKKIQLAYVPTIRLDGEIIMDAIDHFVRELCKKFGNAKPAECANSGAYAASAAFGVLTIVVTILFT